MRKFAILFACMALLLNGCGMFGISEEKSSSNELTAGAAVEQNEPVAAPAASKAPEKAKKTAKTKAVKGAKSEAQIKAELDKMGVKLAAQSARTILPNINKKDIKKVGSEWVVSYIAIDTNKVTTEMRPGANGQYVGSIHYQENLMECRGATKEAALKAPCKSVRSRNLNELIRYDGKVWQD